MDLTERIDESIESLKDPESKVFDFDKVNELLLELKKVIKEDSISQNVIENYETKVEDLNKTVTSLMAEKEVFATRYNVCMGELDKFYAHMHNEIASKMRLLKYTDAEIYPVSRIRNFSELTGLRDKILNEFDVKFKVQYIVSDSPGKKTIDYSLFKI